MSVMAAVQHAAATVCLMEPLIEDQLSLPTIPPTDPVNSLTISAAGSQSFPQVLKTTEIVLLHG